jgi:hypothetical protein
MLFDTLQIPRRTPEESTGKMRLWLYAIIGLSLVGLVCSCSTTTHYGRLQSSHDITQLFEKAQVLSDHTYYYSGLQGVPDAIIGIHPNYSLKAKLWQQVDLSHLTLKKWTFRMNYAQLVAPRGSWILGPDGDRLGIWYAAERQTSVRLDKENRLVIAPPQPLKLRGIR